MDDTHEKDIKAAFLKNVPEIRGSDAFYSQDFNIKRLSQQTPQTSNLKIYKGMIDATLSSLFYSFNTIVIKETKNHSPKFTSFNFSFWRGITSCLVLYFYIRKTEPRVRLFKFSMIKHKTWLITRTFGFYFGFVFFCWAVTLLRTSLAQVLCSIAPVISLLVAVLLGETFYCRYLVGIIICFVGSVLIVWGERNNTNKEQEKPIEVLHLILGISSAIINCLASGFVNVAQKVLGDDRLSNNVQVFYVSLVLIICSLVFCTVTLNFGLDWIVISMGTLNGGFYYFANHYFQEALKVLNVSGSVPFVYFCTLFVFVESVFILGEPLYFTDILGSLIIVSFHFYNAWKPINEEK